MDEFDISLPPTPVVSELAPPRRRILLPMVLFAATCFSTLVVAGPVYAAAIMLILLTHELGHFLQAVRYGVPASLPYFIPMPISPIGTMGAVIAMQPRIGNRRTLFDIGLTGPLAGLVPALICSIVGLQWSQVVSLPGEAIGMSLGEPILFKILAHFTFGPLAEGQDIALHPLAYAGWVGILITAINLFPIGQLDGGHVLYALLLKRAHAVAQVVLVGAMIAVALFGYWGWTLMILLLALMGPRHPPTADDWIELGTTRTLLGWASLLFLFIGFTPVPFKL